MEYSSGVRKAVYEKAAEGVDFRDEREFELWKKKNIQYGDSKLIMVYRTFSVNAFYSTHNQALQPTAKSAAAERDVSLPLFQY